MNRVTAAVAVVLMWTVTFVNGYPLDRVQPNEDEPGWNCATMGNRICGPTVYDGPVRLVAYSDNYDCTAEDHAANDYADDC